MANMVKQYGAKKAKKVFYASRNAGKIKGVDHSKKSMKKKNPSQGKKVNPVLSAAGKKGFMKKKLTKIMKDRK